MEIDRILSGVEKAIPSLTLGDLITLHQLLDREICRQLNLAPISDTMDLRSANIRKEEYSYDDTSHENIQ